MVLACVGCVSEFRIEGVAMKIKLVALAIIVMATTSVEAIANNYPHCRRTGSHAACMACKLAQGSTNVEAMRKCSRLRGNR